VYPESTNIKIPVKRSISQILAQSRFSVLFDHRDELPSFPDSAILFKVRFAALTIHFLSTPPANGNSSEVDSKMDSKPQAIR
jgi:hypothetical protein